MPLKINNKKVNFIVSNNKPVSKILINDEVKYEFDTSHWASDYLEYTGCYEASLSNQAVYSVFLAGKDNGRSFVNVVVLSPSLDSVLFNSPNGQTVYCKLLIIDRAKGIVWYLPSYSSTSLTRSTFSTIHVKCITPTDKNKYGNTKVYTFRKKTLANFKNLVVSLIENTSSSISLSREASKAMAFGESNSADLNYKTPNVGDDSDTILHIGHSNPDATVLASIASAAGSNTLVATNGLAVGHLTLTNKVVPDDPTTEDYVFDYTYSMTYYEPKQFTAEYRHTVDYNYTLYKHPDGTQSGSFITNGFIKADTTVTSGSGTSGVIRSESLIRLTFGS